MPLREVHPGLQATAFVLGKHRQGGGAGDALIEEEDPAYAVTRLDQGLGKAGGSGRAGAGGGR